MWSIGLSMKILGAGNETTSAPTMAIYAVCCHSRMQTARETATLRAPERWLVQAPSISTALAANAKAAALHGPRSCIRQSFDRGEFACLLAGVVGQARASTPRQGHAGRGPTWPSKQLLTSKVTGGVYARMRAASGS